MYMHTSARVAWRRRVNAIAEKCLFRRGASLLPPRSGGPPLLSGMKFCHEILETLGYHVVKTQSLSRLVLK